MIDHIHPGKGNDMPLPVISIVGRPNVGKSTLFNRLLGTRDAITDEKPGSTRDRNCKRTEWEGVPFILVDTGGYKPVDMEEIDSMVNLQVEYAISESDILLFVLDAQTGTTDLDIMIASKLRKTNISVIPLLNKADHSGLDDEIYNYLKLGFGEPFPVSAKFGRNTSDFLDFLTEKLPKKSTGNEILGGLRLAIIGKMNVGKSSIVNLLVGEDVVLTSSKAGTTRDATDTLVKRQGKKFTLVDTAGLRRKDRIEDGVGFYAYVRSLRAIDRCDIAIVVIDVSRSISAHDLWIGRLALEAGKGVIIAANKWDLISKDHKTLDHYSKSIYAKLRFLRFAPIVFISAVTGRRVVKLLDIAQDVFQAGAERVPTAEINKFVKRISEERPPPFQKGRETKILYCTQTGKSPPSFTLFTNSKTSLPAHYRRFLANRIRTEYGFLGNPIVLRFRERKR